MCFRRKQEVFTRPSVITFSFVCKVIRIESRNRRYKVETSEKVEKNRQESKNDTKEKEKQRAT